MNVINQVHLEANGPEEVMGNLEACKQNLEKKKKEATNSYHLYNSNHTLRHTH